MAMRKSPCVAGSRSPLVASQKSPSLVRRVCREFRSRAVTVAVSPIHRTARELLLKSARERMDIIAAYREAGTYRGAAQIAGTTHKTVKRVIARHEAGGAAPERVPRGRNYDGVAALVAERVEKTSGRISARRLLPAARAAVWSPGGHLVIDWGRQGGLRVFCAVLAWCRFRFVRFAADERAETTLAMLAECFEVLGGVPGVVLADRMGCLKGGVVANVVVPTAEYVR